MTEIERRANKKSFYYKKYSEDETLRDMLSRPQSFVEGAIEEIVNLLRQKAYRDGYINGAEESTKELQEKLTDANKIVWYDVKEKLPPQEGHTCFSKRVMTDTGHWCYFDFAGHKWFWNNRKINVKKWCNFEIPDFKEK